MLWALCELKYSFVWHPLKIKCDRNISIRTSHKKKYNDDGDDGDDDDTDMYIYAKQ